jgi:ribosomal-protein-alanine N-acetyltransferase
MGSLLTSAINTARLWLRPLKLADVSPRYLSWFDDPEVQRYIAAARVSQTQETLSAYVADRQDRDDVLFLGIFARDSGAHIGTIKYEPVDVANRYAVMGIMIGEPTFRGKGLAQEAIVASSRWLQTHCGTTQIVLGVHRENVPAIRAYERIGFVTQSSPWVPMTDPEGMTMVWNLGN